MYARDQSKYNTLHRLDVILDVLGYTVKISFQVNEVVQLANTSRSK